MGEAPEEARRILVIDDEAGIRKLFGVALRRAGFTVTSAASGDEAWATLDEGEVDLVLLDLGLPGEGGEQLLASLREREEDIALPVIVVTGDPGPRHRVELLGSGADDYLVKPVDLDELIARVRARLRVQDPRVADRRHAARRNRARTSVREAIDRRTFHPVYQPIVDLRDGAVVAYEALTRFDDGTRPDVRFEDAAACGLGLELEHVTLAAAVAGARHLPGGAALSVNVSVGMLMDDRLDEVQAGVVDRPLVLELTEHERVDDYGAVHVAAHRFGPDVRLSVDDAGSGYSSLRHVLALKPHYVKLDRGWVAGIDEDPARQALILGIGQFVEKLGGAVVAEGIETEAEARVLRELQIPLGQGWLFGRPQPVDDLISLAV